MAHPICNCLLACDIVKICEPGYKWDFIECDCMKEESSSISKESCTESMESDEEFSSKSGSGSNEKP